MKSAQVFCTALIALGVTFTPSPAQAQSWNAPGPYYAFPAWSQKIPASARFWVLTDWNGEAVLDRETGLVWQRNPGSFQTEHLNAQYICESAEIGGRYGWRLPFIHELTSLRDSTDPLSFPPLPAGHPFALPPFINATVWTWSSTSFGPDAAMGVLFHSTAMAVVTHHKSLMGRVWCVRGGNSARP